MHNPLDSIYEQYKKLQDNVETMWLCGYMTDKMKEKLLIENARWALQQIFTVELPEDQTWEIKEYQHMAQTIN